MADPATLTFAIMAVVGIISTIMVSIMWIVKNLLRSKEGKEIDYSKSKKRGLILISSLDNFARFRSVQNFISEGVKETKPFKKRKHGEPRKIFQTPQRVEVGDLSDEVEKEEMSELTRQCVQNLINLNSEKVFLRDAKIPLTVAVEDKVIDAGIKGLGALAFYKKLEDLANMDALIKGLKDNAQLKKLGEVLESFIAKISLIDFDVIRDHFNDSYNQMTKEAENELHYNIGYRDGQSKGRDDYKIFLYGGIAFGIMGIASGLLMALLV